MHLHVGTSGFSYAEWKGSFYPAGAKDKELLELYAQKLGCVEINNTFYRMPKPDVLEGWAARVPEGFSFVLKASQRITHRQKLQDCADNMAYLWKVAQSLGPKLGPILFQLPPFLRKDMERLSAFLNVLPEGMRAVIEFRHRSWFDDEVLELLRSKGVCLCFSDVDPASADDPGLEQPFASTARFGYVRLRCEQYTQPDFDAWAQTIKQKDWDQVYVFFKHEPTAPTYALSFRERFAAL